MLLNTQLVWTLRTGWSSTQQTQLRNVNLTSGKSNESVDGLFEASVSLIGCSGLQCNKVGEVWAFSVLHRAPQPLYHLGHAALLGLVQGCAIQHPHWPATGSRMWLHAVLPCCAGMPLHMLQACHDMLC